MTEELSVRNVPQSKAYRIMACGDPNCGPHVVLYDHSGRPMCQMVLHTSHAIHLAEQLVEFCVDKGGLK